MAIEGISTTIKTLANKLLDSDADKVITNDEVAKFVEDNEAELTEAKIDTKTAAKEIKEVLKDNLADDAKVDDTKDTEEVDTKATDDATLKALEDELALLKKDLEALEGEKTALEEKKKELEEEIATEEENYKKLEQEIKEENEIYQKTIEKIDEATKDLEAEAARESKHAAAKALAEYEPEVDGEWDSYIEKYMATQEVDPSFTAAIKKLTNKANFSANNLSDLGAQLSKAGSKLHNLDIELKGVNLDIKNKTDQIATKNEEISAKEAEIKKAKIAALKGTPGATADIDTVWECVPDGEKALAEEMGLDLTEKLPDGNPRFIFAKGTSVDEGAVYHIYDMANWNENGDNSLVRLKYGYDETSLSMIPIGNGGITPGTFNYTEGGEGGMEIFYMDDCDTIMSNCACYQTWSPLSLDLNGDGVKTSDKIIDYDIDGDGVIDKINDSADAVLVFDKDHNGVAGEDGSEAFGNSTDLDGDGKADGYKDGFEALKALAKKEGLIGDGDNKLDEKDLKILEEKWGLGIKKGGYTDSASSLADAGVTEINLAATDETSLEDNFDGNGNQLMTQKGATFKVNGETREYADIWHKKHGEGSSEDVEASALTLDLNYEEINKEIKKNVAQLDVAKEISAQAEKDAQAKFDSDLYTDLGDYEYSKFKHDEQEKTQKAEQKEQEAKEAEAEKIEAEKKAKQ